MAVVKICLVAFLVCIFAETAFAGMKRSISNSLGQEEQKWKPVTGTKQFKVNVADGIKGANQQREETWNNGTVTGSFIAPAANGQWQETQYIADANGYRIVSTKLMNADQIMHGHDAVDHTANVDIESSDNKPIHYTVTEAELKAAAAKNKDIQDSSKQN